MDHSENERLPEALPEPESAADREAGENGSPERAGQTSSRRSGTGYLTVHVTTARGAIPLEGAQVDVSNYLPEDVPEGGNLIASLVSGRDGNTAVLPLPAPSREESQTPENAHPYASYTLEVRMPGYFNNTYIGFPVFDGVTSIQPADLIPLPEDGTGGTSPGGELYYESSSPEL